MSEQTTSQIAKSYGVSRKSLVAWLRQVAPKEWLHVQLVRAHDRKETGNEELEVADDPLSLARAREKLKSAQWELQAIDPDYQPKQHVTVEQVGDLGERLRRARERVIEAEPVAEQPQTQRSIEDSASTPKE
jgi:transcriptional/translational regulatory protein YebC/TACO1